jgi:ABC-type transport system involved in cytochrome bd biosynthesis fused ATPase/permease subunit
LFDELLEHARDGKAVLVAGHRAAVAAPADRVVVLDNGRLSE